MSGIFPESTDGGVGPAGALNSYTPHNTPTCTPLFFPNTCNGVVRGALLNALTSEIGVAVDNAGATYDCSAVDNLSRAIMLHGQTVGYCGDNRATAETQKGDALVPGDFWLNTTESVVYFVDATNTDWPLPNQPSSFLCANGTLWARHGNTYNPVIGSVEGAIPATDINVTACPSGPVNLGMSVQDAICLLSQRINALTNRAQEALAIQEGAFEEHANYPKDATFGFDHLVVSAPYVTIPSAGTFRLYAGTYYFSTTIQYNDSDTAANQPILYAIDPADTILARGSYVTGAANGRGGNLSLVITLTSQTDVRLRAVCRTYWARGHTYVKITRIG